MDTGTTYALGDLVHPTPLSTEWDIPIDVPATVPGSNFLLSLSVVDDTFANFLSGSPAPSPGDIFEVTLNGRSLGTTGVVGLGGPPSSGNFNVVVRGGSTFLLGITDLLQPYADGLTDTLPSTLCGPSCAGLDGGIVQSSAFDANILDLFPTITPAPEPASLGLVAGGIAVLGLVRRRRRAG